MEMKAWVHLPSTWVQRYGLKEFSWRDGGSDNTAALMALIAIAHRADQETGSAHLTYDNLCCAVGISRAKLSRGLQLLEERKIVSRNLNGRSSFQLSDYSLSSGWCKLPAKLMYRGEIIEAFRHFTLRQRAELNALKLYLLFAARRGRDTNLANISYEKITEYSGVRAHEIKPATSMLGSLSLAYVERLPSAASSHGIANAYRLVGLDSRRHMGTIGRRLGEFDLEPF